MRLSNVIIRPLMTEKSYSQAAEDKYLFAVNMKASKNSVANEVERLFGVNVIGVNTMIMPGKKRRILRSRKFTKTHKWKKAVVQLKSGEHIDFVEKESN